MYYHCLSLRYVEYGTILPHDDETGWNRPAYRWLGTYCGYFPQIWLSRADIGMTGYRSALRPRSNRGRQRRVLKDQVLFGFDQVHGFPVESEFWGSFALNAGLNHQVGNPADVEESLVLRLNWAVEFADEDEETASFLRKYAFVERNQFVVPSLNLKTAKRILCRNEKQKKALRQLGFIEDRIEIRNMLRW
jgi:hypothetical protein